MITKDINNEIFDPRSLDRDIKTFHLFLSLLEHFNRNDFILETRICEKYDEDRELTAHLCLHFK